MPRGVHVTRVLPKLTKTPSNNALPRTSPLSPNHRKEGPNLYNAKRRIPVAHGIVSRSQRENYARNLEDESWRTIVSPDVTQYLDDMEAEGRKLLPEERKELFRNPAKWFSRPKNVPTSLREQVYFPNWSVALRRNEYLGPMYAQFEVPLWFSKLDLKGYLSEVYGVEVVHIRSYVTPARLERKNARSPYTRGPLVRKPSEKRMTVQLVEPFVWPKKPKDVKRSDFFPEQYYKIMEEQQDAMRKEADLYKEILDKKHRKSIAEQAEELLQGKAKWSPTWQNLPESRRLMGDFSSPSTADTNSEYNPSR